MNVECVLALGPTIRAFCRRTDAQRAQELGEKIMSHHGRCYGFYRWTWHMRVGHQAGACGHELQADATLGRWCNAKPAK